MADYTLEQMMEEWQKQLTPLGLDLQKVSHDEQEFLEVQDLKTKKKMTISTRKLEGKVQEIGLASMLTTYTNFVRDWQALISEPIMIEKSRVFPCIRPSSILRSPSVQDLQTYPHTAETVIVLALDQKRGYKLLTKTELADTDLSAKAWFKQSLENLRALPYAVKKQTVAGSDFYFFHQNDGYDASRILLEDLWLAKTQEERSSLTLSIPHQDVLIVAKCKDDIGLEILSKMTMEFYSEGRSPITSFSFHYPDGQSMPEPIFIFLK